LSSDVIPLCPFTRRHQALQQRYHAHCVFQHNPLVAGLRFWFDGEGVLHGSFWGTAAQQGYTGMVHGGIVAAVIDASMAQCLMGHGIVGYTTDLSVKYRQKVLLDEPVTLRTAIERVSAQRLYRLRTNLSQHTRRVVQAEGMFYKVEQAMQ
jgi:acyl-coenzyme A thioesterase PaaI-like protein